MGSSSNHPALLQELVLLADDLVGASSGRELLRGLERQLGRIGCLPAQLHLMDPDGGALYPAAILGEGAPPLDDCDELPITLMYQPGSREFPLFQHGEPVGLLRVTPGPYDERILQRLALLLGPSLVSVQQHEETLADLRHVHEQRNMLLSAGGLLRHLDLEVLLVRILETVLTTVQAQVGAVLTVPDDGQRLATRVTWGIQDHHVDAVRTSDGQRVVDRAFAEQRVLCYRGAAVAEELDLSELDARLDSVLLLPLTSSERGHGIVFLANPQNDFDQSVRQLGETVCNMAAIALDNVRLIQATVDRERLRSELSIATRVQANMFPEAGLVCGGVRVEGASTPCDETGGDYFTFQENDGILHAMIADVTGHGLGAALYTTMAHAVIQQQLHSGSSSSACFNALSTALRYSNSERFMTAALVDIDVTDLRCTYVSAGHNPLLLLRADGGQEWLDSTCLPLGIMPDLDCVASPPLQLRPGDVLVLYTDGFTEAANPAGEQFGEERMADLLAAGVRDGVDPQRLIGLLQERVHAWMDGTEQADDLTVVVIGVDAMVAAADAADSWPAS